MGRIKNNWRQRGSERTTLGTELRVIPHWLVWLLFALYVVALATVIYLSGFMPTLPLFGIEGEPLALKLLAVFGIVTALAIAGSAFVMLFGYIGADAKRRGMSPVLWVLVSLLVPYLIGAIIYFVVREPLPFNCPQCGRAVNAQFNFCPSCQFNLRPNCPQCRREIRTSDRFCPQCGLAQQAVAAAPPAQADARAV
ncbi:MAG TPA: zinc ribbon domain-containing protein [Terriglobia bacterium]|nr:zinc ribbon domain-containing protein [Terriglobia bacterium]